MKLEIVRMHLENFKGIKDKEITLDGNTKISGANGAGKTSCADAFYWVFCNCNTALVKEPPITPYGMPECASRVEIEMVIDDKPITVEKSQKFKSREEDGKTISSVTNHYKINGVEKSATNFVKDLNERGINMERFLILSHVFAFTADTSKKGREEMRNILFEMVEGITDYDIAREIAASIPGVIDKLSTGYKIDEVEQMAKAELKALLDKYGKDGSTIDAKIDGLNEGKSEVDETVLNEQKKSYEAEIERCEKELSDLSSSKADMSKKISDLRIKVEEIKREANIQLNNDRSGLEKTIREFTAIIDENSFKVSQLKAEKLRKESLLAESKQDIENQRIKYKVEQDAVMDESDLSCPICHKPYSESKVKKIKDEFERNKTEKLKTIKNMGEELKAQIESFEQDLTTLSKNIENLEKVIKETEDMRSNAQKRLDDFPLMVDVTTNTEYVEVTGKMLALETELMKSDDARQVELEECRDTAKGMLKSIISDLGKAEHNKEIDSKIAELRELKKDVEIQRANAEKKVNEVEVFKKYKNSKLSDEINSHFKIAKFRLFKVLKNGSVEDDCSILVDGKELNSQLNQSLQVLALADVCAGLQEKEQQFIPVFLDNHALFTSKNDKAISLKCQTIKLIAAEGLNELKIEKGE